MDGGRQMAERGGGPRPAREAGGDRYDTGEARERHVIMAEEAPGKYQHADSGSADAGEEAGVCPPASASSVTTTSPRTAGASAGVENSPAPDDAPVPVAQISAAYEEAEKGNANHPRGVEVIDSSGGDVPVPVGLMDTSCDEAEMGSAGSKMMARKGVELVDGDDEGPDPPGHTADDGSDSKLDAKKTKAERVRDAARNVHPRATTHPAGVRGDSVHEAVFEEDAEHLHTSSTPREDWLRTSPMRERVRPPPPSMLPRNSTASDPAAEPSLPMLEAHLVEEELVDAVPLEEEHWAKRHQRKIIGGFVLVIVALVVALGVAFGTGGGEDAAERTVTIFATSPPTRSLSPSTSFVPTSSTPPSLRPTVSPSLEPSDRPSMYSRPCFVDREELKAAVDSYAAGGDTCRRGESECEVAQKYGWPIGTWCTSNVTDMSLLFSEKDTFDEDLFSWDTSQVTSMDGMFQGASSFNGDVSNFDTSNVTSMYGMFIETSSFNRGISNFDTSAVTSMEGMFAKARVFNGDLSNFDTSKVTSMFHMFGEASAFNGDLSSFNTSKVTDMETMFVDASSFNGDLSNFDTSKVTSMVGMFTGAISFNGNVSNFDTSQVTSMYAMFNLARAFNGDLPWDTSKVTSMGFMLSGSSFNGDTSSFDTSSVTDMNSMFGDASLFNQNVSGFDVSSVTDISQMFKGATLFNQDLCAWGAHYNATGVNYFQMFQGTNCASEGDPQGPYTNWCAATCNSTEQTPA